MHRLKIGLAILIIFICGFVAGGVGALSLVHHKIKRAANTGEPLIDSVIVKRLNKELDLNSDQRIAAHKALTTMRKRTFEIRKRNYPEYRLIMDEAAEEFAETLNEEQQARLDELRQQAQEKWAPQ